MYTILMNISADCSNIQDVQESDYTRWQTGGRGRRGRESHANLEM
jgi:hypothetical protein